VPDFMVLKLTTASPVRSREPASGSNASDWQPVLIAQGVPDEEAAAKQAYSGEGTYKVLPWDDDAQVAVTPGEPEVTMVSKREVAEAAEVAEAEAVRDGE
jgi:hypothetical protein